MLRAALVPLLVVVLLAGCAEPTPDPGAGPGPGPGEGAPTPGGPPTATTPTPLPPQETPLAVRTLAYGTSSEIAYPVRLVFTDRAEWESFWREHHKKTTDSGGQESPVPPAPEVDFERERVVAVTLGDRPDPCHHVRITNATMAEGVTFVTVTAYLPPPDRACITVVSQPYVMAALPRDGGEIVYRDEEVRGPPPE